MEKQYVLHSHAYGANLYSFPADKEVDDIVYWFLAQEDYDEEEDSLDFLDGIYDVKI